MFNITNYIKSPFLNLLESLPFKKGSAISLRYFKERQQGRVTQKTEQQFLSWTLSRSTDLSIDPLDNLLEKVKKKNEVSNSSSEIISVFYQSKRRREFDQMVEIFDSCQDSDFKLSLPNLTSYGYAVLGSNYCHPRRVASLMSKAESLASHPKEIAYSRYIRGLAQAIKSLSIKDFLFDWQRTTITPGVAERFAHCYPDIPALTQDKLFQKYTIERQLSLDDFKSAYQLIPSLENGISWIYQLIENGQKDEAKNLAKQLWNSRNEEPYSFALDEQKREDLCVVGILAEADVEDINALYNNKLSNTLLFLQSHFPKIN